MSGVLVRSAAGGVLRAAGAAAGPRSVDPDGTRVGHPLQRRLEAAASGPGLRRPSALPLAPGGTRSRAGTLPLAPPTVSEVLASPGRPLDPLTVSQLGPRLRPLIRAAPPSRVMTSPARMRIGATHDAEEREAHRQAAIASRDGAGDRPLTGDEQRRLRAVRVHTDARAARSAQLLRADAYAIGDHIVFGRSRYEPASPQGRRLIAHELVHVLREPAGGEVLRRQAPIASPSAVDLSSRDAVLQEVRAAMGVVQTEGGGVGDFPRALAALTPLTVDVLMAVSRELARSHEAEVLLSNIAAAPAADALRIRTALSCAMLIELPAADISPERLSDAAAALAQAEPTLREQILRALVRAKLGAQMVETTMEGIAAMIAAGAPTLNPALAGVSGPVAPGPWAPPGSQPIPFYIGTAAHLAIAAGYVLANAGDVVRTNTFSIAGIFDLLSGPPFNLTPARNNLTGDRLRGEPDIANLTKHVLYEIKPTGSEALARTEALWYAESFTLAGLPMTLGPSGVAGTSGVVPAPGGVFLFSSPEPGVIVYQLTRMQVVRVPSTERREQRESEFKLAPISPQVAVGAAAAIGLGAIMLMILRALAFAAAAA